MPKYPDAKIKFSDQPTETYFRIDDCLMTPDDAVEYLEHFCDFSLSERQQFIELLGTEII